MKIDRGFAGEVVSKAIHRGADEAEVFMKISKSLSVEIKEQEVDALKSSESLGYSLRVIKAGRLGFSYATDADDGDAVIAKAIEAARFSDPDNFLGLPEAGTHAAVSILDPQLKSIDEEEAIKAVMLMERSVYGADSRI